MRKDVKNRYRKFRSGKSGYWYIQDNESGQQKSLRTADEAEAQRLLQARNEALRQPAINVQIARAYLTASDPKLVTRTWQEVMGHLLSLKKDETHRRWSVAIKDKNFDHLRHLPLLET